VPHAAVPKVAIVILNWNDGAATLACLKALRSTAYPNYDVIVVDNGSVDGSLPPLGDAGPFDIVINQTKLGYKLALRAPWNRVRITSGC
jgi:GT2 family glycosyltransferase